MKILVVSPDLPYPPVWGFGMRVYQLIRHLAMENEVTLLSYARPDQEPEARELRKICAAVRVVPGDQVGALVRRTRQLTSLMSRSPFHGRELLTRQMQNALDECLASGAFDIVQIESSQLAGLNFSGAAPLILDEHNIESELLRRMQQGERSLGRRLFNRREARKYERLEEHVWSNVDACVVTSDREREVIAGRSSVPTAVVPNGVDPEHFAPSDVPVEPDTMVFNGLLTYRPNVDAAHYFINEVLPGIRRIRPNAVLRIVGYGTVDELERLRRPGVIVTGWVPDVRPYLARAAVVVVPIRMGGGTRLKVIEALSMKKPVVSTSVGCEGIEVQPGEHLLVADEAGEFARLVCRLLSDAALAARLAAEGRRLAVRDYSWQRCGELLMNVHKNLSRTAGASFDPSPPTAEADDLPPKRLGSIR